MVTKYFYASTGRRKELRPLRVTVVEVEAELTIETVM